MISWKLATDAETLKSIPNSQSKIDDRKQISSNKGGYPSDKLEIQVSSQDRNKELIQHGDQLDSAIPREGFDNRRQMGM